MTTSPRANPDHTTAAGTGKLGLAGLVLLLAAAAMAAVLAVAHIPGITPVGCGAGGGCDKIKNSALGIVPGTDAVISTQNAPLYTEPGWPTAYLGLGYFFALALVWGIGINRGVHQAVYWVARVGGLASLGYLLAMANEGALCPWCLGVHLCNFAFIGVMETQRIRAAKARPRPAHGDDTVRPAAFGLVPTVALALVAFAATSLGVGVWHNTAARAEMAKADAEGDNIFGPGSSQDADTPKDPTPQPDPTPEPTPEPGPIIGTPQQLAVDDIEQVQVASWEELGLPAQVHGPDRAGADGFTGRYLMGPVEARVRIVMVSNPTCPFCRTLKSELNQLLRERDDVSLSVLHFPLSSACNPVGGMGYRTSCQRSYDLEAAGIMGGPEAYWAVNDFLYKAYEQAGGVSNPLMRRQIEGLGLDWDTFEQLRSSERVREIVSNDVETGLALGITQTPYIFLNGQPFLNWRVPGNTARIVARAIEANPDRVPPVDSSRDVAPTASENFFRVWAQTRQRHAGLLAADIPAFTGGLEPAPDAANSPIQIVAFIDYAHDRSRNFDRQLRAAIAEADDVIYQPRLFPLADGCNPFAVREGGRDSSACIAALTMATTRRLGDASQVAQMHAALIDAELPITQDTARSLFQQVGLDAEQAAATMAERDTLQLVVVDANTNHQAEQNMQAPAPYVNGRLNLFWEYNDEFRLDELIENLRPLLANPAQRPQYMPVGN
jgi:protein-disulfide isomerase/uncharacterized membrane protein